MNQLQRYLSRTVSMLRHIACLGPDRATFIFRLLTLVEIYNISFAVAIFVDISTEVNRSMKYLTLE